MIGKKEHTELIEILEELIMIISSMREEDNDYLLFQNESEARAWLSFLRGHRDKEELKSLENEISDRFFFKFNVQIGYSNLDDKRAELIEKYMKKSNEYLK